MAFRRSVSHTARTVCGLAPTRDLYSGLPRPEFAKASGLTISQAQAERALDDLERIVDAVERLRRQSP